MTTYRIQFRLPEFRCALKGDGEWKDMNGEEFRHVEVAELRKSGYWEKMSMPLEFRVTEGTLETETKVLETHRRIREVLSE